MLRRTFLQWLIASPLGFLVGKKETQTLPIANTPKPPLLEWETGASIQFDALTDGTIVSMMPYHDSIVVACQWSIWEIHTDDVGEIVATLIARIDRT